MEVFSCVLNRLWHALHFRRRHFTEPLDLVFSTVVGEPHAGQSIRPPTLPLSY